MYLLQGHCLLKDGFSNFPKDESVEVSQTEYHHP